MLVELTTRFSEIGRRVRRFIKKIATRIENSAAGASLARDCVARGFANAEFVQNLAQSPRRIEVNRFAMVLRGEFVLVQRRSYEQCVARTRDRAYTRASVVFYRSVESLLRVPFGEQGMALPSEQKPPYTKSDDRPSGLVCYKCGAYRAATWTKLYNHLRQHQSIAPQLPGDICRYRLDRVEAAACHQSLRQQRRLSMNSEDASRHCNDLQPPDTEAQQQSSGENRARRRKALVDSAVATFCAALGFTIVLSSLVSSVLLLVCFGLHPCSSRFAHYTRTSMRFEFPWCAVQTLLEKPQKYFRLRTTKIP